VSTGLSFTISSLKRRLEVLFFSYYQAWLWQLVDNKLIIQNSPLFFALRASFCPANEVLRNFEELIAGFKEL
jgi:hypothetical protein